MKELILCELPGQTDFIENELTGDEIIVALNYPSSYALERKGLPFSEVYQYYQHGELWGKYLELSKSVLQLTNCLDEVLFEIDERFKNESLNIFDLLHYPIKISIDYIRYVIFILNKIFEVTPVKHVKCLEIREPVFTESFLYADTFSIVSWVVRLLKPKFNYEIEWLPYPQEQNSKQQFFASFSFGQPSLKTKNITKNLLLKIQHLFQYIGIYRDRVLPKPDLTVLSVACKEIDVIKTELSKNNIRVIKYISKIEFLTKKGVYAHTDKILDFVKNDAKIQSLLTFEDTNYFDIFSHNLRMILNGLEHLFQLNKNTKNYFALNKNIDAVFINTTAPFFPPNVFFIHLCKEREIPYLCWMHGGYGANYSLPGYDITDYRMAQLHFVYGQSIKRLLISEQCVTKMFQYENLESYVSGSPYFEKSYRNYKKPKNKKKKILLSIGNHHGYNRFYFGHNKPYTELCNWEEHKAIIELLIKYQDKYHIIVKDYHYSTTHQTFKNLLKDLGGNQIELIYIEKSFDSLLVISDLHIFTWVSTTFMQSLYTESDIFLFDKSDITEEAKALFEKYIGFSATNHDFIEQLDEYLSDGLFYIQNKNPLRHFFIDYSNRNQRAKIVGDAINHALNNRRDIL